MTPFDPIPVTILTGFLGAGKTALLNRLLKDPALADTAVIINEFGEVAIDHLLVEQATDGVIQLSDGCLCCTVRGDLVDTLADLVDRLQTGKIGSLKRVIVETTGLADPVPVLQSIMAHPVLLQAYRLDGVVTLVDAVNGAATLDAHTEAVRQVAVADRLVLTKEDLLHQDPLTVSAAPIHLSPASQGRGTPAGKASALQDPGFPPLQHQNLSSAPPSPDLGYSPPSQDLGSSPMSQGLGSSPLRSGGEVDRRSRDGEGVFGDFSPNGEGTSPLKTRLHRLNPGASIIPVTAPDIARLVTSCGIYDPETKTADVRRWLGETHDHSHHDHDHHADDRHHDHRHDARVSSISLVSDKPILYAALETFLDLLRSVHGERLLRLKGIVELAEQPQRPLVVHAVQEVFHPPARLPSWPDDRRGVRLVLIGFDLAEDHVRRLFAAVTDHPAIDQPDRAALEANPLAIAGV